MVFHSDIKKNKTPPYKSNSLNMSSVSQTTVVKSQATQKPLHNFSLPDLRWAMNHTNTHRFRKPSDSDQHRQKHKQAHHHKRKSIGDDVAGKLVEKPAPSEAGSLCGDGSRSKILIRIKTKSSKVADEVANAGDHNSALPDDDSDDLLVSKTWNFRPRRLVTKINNNNVNEGCALKIGGGAAPEKKEKGKDRDKKDKEEEEMKKEKMKFSISLKKEEIEDDFFALTGTKPSRRPKKRAKNVQKQVDYVFPGLWLASITPDSYMVNDGTKKG